MLRRLRLMRSYRREKFPFIVKLSSSKTKFKNTQVKQQR